MLKGYRGRNRGCEKIASIEHALSIVTLTLLNLIGSPFLLEMEKSSLLFLNSIWKRINVNGSGLRDELGQDRRENCICQLEIPKTEFQFRRYTSSFFNFTPNVGGRRGISSDITRPFKKRRARCKHFDREGRSRAGWMLLAI